MFKKFGKVMKSRKGYTLTELIVVVVILGILAVIATPVALNTIQKTKVRTDENNVKIIQDAVQRLIMLDEISLVDTEDKGKSDVINSVLNGEFSKGIPATQQKNFKFYLNRNDGTVSCTDKPGTGLVELIPNPNK